MVANLLPLAAWVAAHADSLAWLGEHYVREDRRLEALLLAHVLVPALRWVRGLSRLREPPRARPGPLLLLAGATTWSPAHRSTTTPRWTAGAPG